ncbi:uncharacterized protein LOC128953278 [Oppia nitens]|uniref:uncharacterized protein LOC128953278 n=1 Tax=Oppia nitens TaxID=1686743 RepID=UPI0023D991CF|nr:uncharacterized protein LOC128953278 [Oppia nitens]
MCVFKRIVDFIKTIMFGKQLVSFLTILLITTFNCYICFKDIIKECPELPFIRRSEWGARLSKQSLQPSKLPVQHLFIHSTSSHPGHCLDLNSCIRAVSYIQDYQMDILKHRDISYNVLIGGDGRIYSGRSTLSVGSKPIGLANQSLTIAFVGQYDFGQGPSQLMLDTAQRFIKCLERVGDRLLPDYQLHGHRDQTCTASPGNFLYDIIKKWPHYQGGPLPTFRCNDEGYNMMKRFMDSARNRSSRGGGGGGWPGSGGGGGGGGVANYHLAPDGSPIPQSNDNNLSEINRNNANLLHVDYRNLDGRSASPASDSTVNDLLRKFGLAKNITGAAAGGPGVGGGGSGSGSGRVSDRDSLVGSAFGYPVAAAGGAGSGGPGVGSATIGGAATGGPGVGTATIGGAIGSPILPVAVAVDNSLKH